MLAKYEMQLDQGGSSLFVLSVCHSVFSKKVLDTLHASCIDIYLWPVDIGSN